MALPAFSDLGGVASVWRTIICVTAARGRVKAQDRVRTASNTVTTVSTRGAACINTSRLRYRNHRVFGQTEGGTGPALNCSGLFRVKRRLWRTHFRDKAVHGQANSTPLYPLDE